MLCNVQEALHAHIKPDSRLTIALSGGVDSVVLLHLLSKLSGKIPFSLYAVHVNHGISRNAMHWSQFCCNLCHRHGISIHVAYLKIHKKTGTSLEAIAREERYRVFDQIPTDYIVLAQHLDDQAETLLLQLLRGAGIKGLSGMPLIRKQSAASTSQLLRPLLNVSREQIETYARQNQLDWIHDESNDDIAINRNFLRHEIFPVLKKRYPSYAKTLLRTSRHLSEASLLLDELAEIDHDYCLISGKLSLENLRALSYTRAKNLLRYHLSRHNIPLPSSVKLEDILRQLLSAQVDRQIHIHFGHAEIRCYQGLVHVLTKHASVATPQYCQYCWHGEAELTLDPIKSKIMFMRIKNQGIDQQKIANERITIRTRQGGEYFKPACNRPRRNLKNLLQEASIPPWRRQIMPLLFCNEQLIWVPGIGIDCEFQVKSNDIGIVPIWNHE
ncbi:tRNA lysidine(34) synthetase TilS [Nitrosomonas sp.]|uniref:tRNA lysidine(34) synthetase TilS n=1 Tax=Nitrosomonas sp. TaxID=42353 RepID=UPI0025E47EC3|nr:tRNA lysidine(34) synthetase TilS [Nitrosomonas sp.]